MKIKDKVIVLTGGGNGMGREMAFNLLNKGARVAAVDINEAALLETKKRIGELQDRLSVHVINITDRNAVAALPQEVIKIHGTVDGIINNAGIIQPFIKVNNLDYPVIEQVVNVNFYGTLYMTKAFLPFLLKQAEAHVVNVSSMGGFLPVPGQSIYGAAKAAVKLMTEGLRTELRNSNVNVTVIFPGAIATNIIANSGAEEVNKIKTESKGSSLIQPMSPSKAAQIIIDSIEKNKSRVFVGSDSKLMDFFYRLSPKFATNLIAKQMKSHIPD